MDAKIPGVFGLFKPAFHAYRSNIGRYLSLAIIPIVAAFVIAFIFSILLLGLASVGYLNTGTVTGIIMGVLSLIILVAILAVAVYVQLLASVAILIEARDGGKHTVVEALRAGREYVWRYLLVYMSSGLSVLGAGAILLVPVLFLMGILARAIDLDPLIPDVGETVGMIISWVFLGVLILPAIIVGVWLTLAPFLVINEPTSGKTVSVLTRSQQLVTGHWWAVFGRTLAPLVLFAIIDFATGSSTGEEKLTVLSLVGQVVAIVLTPLVILYFYQLYRALVLLPANNFDEVTTQRRYRILMPVGGVVFVLLSIVFVYIVATF